MAPTVEVSLLDKNSIRIKGKKATLVVDPRQTTPKTVADIILATDKDYNTKKIDEFRLIIEDDGEYEVGGIKVTGAGNIYSINVDNTQVVLAKSSALNKLADTANEAEIALLNVDSSLNEGVIAALEAKAVLLYGEKAREGLKALGKNDLTPVRKFSPAKETESSEETQILWLA